MNKILENPDMIKLIIDGKNFNDIGSFYKEASKVLTNNTIPICSLDGLSDVLGGGFGVFDEKQPVTIVWKNHKKSADDLSYDLTVKYLKEKLKNCHPSNKNYIEKEMEDAQSRKGKTYFDRLVEVIGTEGKDRITLILE